MVTEEFLEIAIESWSEWDLNPRPLNPAETLKPNELSGQNIYIRYIYIFIDVYIFIRKGKEYQNISTIKHLICIQQ